LGGGHDLNAFSDIVGHGTLRVAGGIVDTVANHSFDGNVVVGAAGLFTVRGLRTQFGQLEIDYGGSVALGAGAQKRLIVGGLDMHAGGSLDVSDNTVIVDYTGASPIDAIRAALASGYAGGTWGGAGIRSSAAAAQPGTAIGYAEASDLFANFPATFAGEAVDATTVVLRHTFRAT
jgi:hypothetical protein